MVECGFDACATLNLRRGCFVGVDGFALANFELVEALMVVVLVLGLMCIRVDSLLDQFRGNLYFSSLLSSLGFQLAGVGEYGLQEFPIDEAALLDEMGERALEHGLELFITQDRHFGGVGCGEFVVALPDDSPVFIGGMPGLAAIGCAAVSTVNLACEGAFTPACGYRL